MSSQARESVIQSTGLMLSIPVCLLMTLERDAVAQQSKNKDLTGYVKDVEGEPINDARVVLLYKSWPNQRYRQQTFAARTDETGLFNFKRRYPLKEQTCFLVTIVADGYAMSSQYIENPDGELLDPVEFELEKAIEKTLAITLDGKPLKGAKVFPLSRTTESGEEYLIYHQSAPKVTLKSDDDGRVKMNIFQSGDTVKLGVNHQGEKNGVEIEIDNADEQSVDISKKKATRP